MIDMELIQRASQNYNNHEWLDQNADELYTNLRQALRNHKTAPPAISSMVLFFPYLLNRGDLRRWNKLAYRALRMVDSENARQRVNSHVLQQVYVEPDYAREHARPRRPRSERIDQNEMFETYLHLLNDQLFSHSDQDVVQELVTSALEFGRRLNNQYYYHKLYSVVAFVYVSTMQFDKAYDFAQFSYEYWVEKEDHLEAGLCAFAIAMVYRGKQDWDQNLAWLNVAGDYFSSTNYVAQHGLMAQETANTYIQLRDYVVAKQWAQMAIDEFGAADLPFQQALAYHSMGIAHAYLREYDQALTNLDESLVVWKRAKNYGQQAHTEHTIAFVEAMMSRTNQALSRLHRVIRLLDHVSDSEWKKLRLRKTKRLMEALRYG